MLYIGWHGQCPVGSAFYMDSSCDLTLGEEQSGWLEALCCSQGLAMTSTSGTGSAVMEKEFCDIHVPGGSPLWGRGRGTGSLDLYRFS